ncbi:MAG: Tol-Pal system beta propeller repeat protein TolB [Thiobacillaceae bacterium]|nr:Tol-Pal system beta propeller repeat protein TolB [Thiobacillaceae bacterium]
MHKMTSAMNALLRLGLLLAALPVLLAGHPARAAMTIEIVGGVANRVPIAIVPFARPAGTAVDPGRVVLDDLARSGYFRIVDTDNLLPLPTGPAEVRFPPWRSRGADALLIGQVGAEVEGRVDVRFWLFDVVRQGQLLGMSLTVPASALRSAGHRIADLVHEKLLGEPGNYSGRMAYIHKRDGWYELQVADADSQNAFTVVRSPEPIISPAWSPDGTRLAYVSFERKKPIVYVQRLSDGSRQVFANFRGSNSAPAWSPDGARLAVTLSKDAISQIYLMGADGGEPQRIARSDGLDTEPVFSPDGRWLYFTSDRGGSPQIYRMPAGGGEAQRITYEGGYNVSPAISPDGKSMAYIHRRDGRFQVAVMDLATRQTQVLTDTAFDESPSFAPNGKSILYATLVNGRGVLATVSVDGRVRQRLSQHGDLREPVWAP